MRALWAAVSPVSYYDKFAGAEGGRAGEEVLLVYADYDLTFPRSIHCRWWRRSSGGLNFEPRVLPCGHYTTGETPYKYIDGWYLGSFVRRAFKELREEKAETMSAAPLHEEKEEVVSP